MSRFATVLVCLLAFAGLGQSLTPGWASTEPCADPHGSRGAEPYAPTSAQIAEMQADLEMRRRVRGAAGQVGADEFITVPLWIHLLGDGVRGATTQSALRQVEVLNAAYGGRLGGADTRVRFRLEGVNRVVNKVWFRDPLGNETAMKTALRKGGQDTLNLYIAQLSELVLGYATYPHWYARSPKLDGVVIDWRTLPGGALKNFDRGYTGVHEIGHWLGLLHTFENGCAEPGDHVADTPAAGQATEGCPARKDTCKTIPGDDPIHNFMDYSHDRCMTEFTTGQGVRMREMWQQYRVPAAEPLEISA
ncbi:zinc metalloprotease [Rhizohabitans arisaemae]|uniref:zinc metalloprotease n=1 Tax=Rhizohabitans arisaemae TaxID=2720610 RepID=UPI0024B16506|nr:zinc metalloprotease [Rhizohabitans arisaemae]